VPRGIGKTKHRVRTFDDKLRPGNDIPLRMFHHCTTSVHTKLEQDGKYLGFTLSDTTL
jgi:hypothetical protein